MRKEEAFTQLDRIASYLARHPNTYVYIEGHCDERGSAAYNLALGVKRGCSGYKSFSYGFLTVKKSFQV